MKTHYDIFLFICKSEFEYMQKLHKGTLVILSIKEGYFPQYVFMYPFRDFVDSVVSRHLVLCLSHFELDCDNGINIDNCDGCIFNNAYVFLHCGNFAQ